MSLQDKMTEFNLLSSQLSETKANQKAALEALGQSPTDDWSTYPDLLRAAQAGGNYQDEKTVEADPAGMTIVADDGYNGLLKLIIAADPNFQPWNLVEGIEAWGKVGTAKLAVVDTIPDDYVSEDPDNPTPGTVEDADDQYNEKYNESPSEDMMILVDNDGNTTYGFFATPDFDDGGIELYNGEVTTELNSSMGCAMSDMLSLTQEPECVSKGCIFHIILDDQIYEISSCGNGFVGELDEDGSLVFDNCPIALFVMSPYLFVLSKEAGTYSLSVASSENAQFEITNYSPITTDFSAIGWRRLSYHTTGELAGTWTLDDFFEEASAGWNYLKNIRYCSRKKLYWGSVEVWPNFNQRYPVLYSFNWYSGTTAKKTITKVSFVDSYTVTGSETESWPAAIDMNSDGNNDNLIMCYINGTELTIVGCGVGKIYIDDGNALFQFNAAVSMDGLKLLDTSENEDMHFMFAYNYCLESHLDLSSFDTSKVTTMQSMFYNCYKLPSIDLSSFDTSKVTNFCGMFRDCRSLTSLDLRNFDISAAPSENYLGAMFMGCTSLVEVDLSTWDFSNVTRADSMFSGCTSLKTVYVKDEVAKTFIEGTYNLPTTATVVIKS